jgi:hypothetical protein
MYALGPGGLVRAVMENYAARACRHVRAPAVCSRSARSVPRRVAAVPADLCVLGELGPPPIHARWRAAAQVPVQWWRRPGADSRGSAQLLQTLQQWAARTDISSDEVDLARRLCVCRDGGQRGLMFLFCYPIVDTRIFRAGRLPTRRTIRPVRVWPVCSARASHANVWAQRPMHACPKPDRLLLLLWPPLQLHLHLSCHPHHPHREHRQHRH